MELKKKKARKYGRGEEVLQETEQKIPRDEQRGKHSNEKLQNQFKTSSMNYGKKAISLIKTNQMASTKLSKISKKRTT